MDMDLVEREARRLCALAGGEPERRVREYGQSSWTYPQWELYRDKAKIAIDRRSKGDAAMRQEGFHVV